MPTDLRVDRYTRAGEQGRIIQCPHCRDKHKVYHFHFVVLWCTSCNKGVPKYEWLLPSADSQAKPKAAAHKVRYDLTNLQLTPSMDQLTQEKIQYLLDNFNFERVSLVMQAIEWKWAQEDNSMKVPNIHQLKLRARKLLEDSYTNLSKDSLLTLFGTSTGGLQATCYREDEPDEYGFRLEFILAEYDTEDYILETQS